MNSAQFTIKKTILFNTLKNLCRPLGTPGRIPRDIVLELTITDNLLMLVVPGGSTSVGSLTQGTAKASIGAYYFFDLLKGIKDKNVEVNIFDNAIQVGITTVMVQTTFFEDDSILRSIKLPLNYTDYHLLRLPNQGFTDEEIRFNGLGMKFLYAKGALKRNTSSAVKLLGTYGVTKKDLEQLVHKKLYG